MTHSPAALTGTAFALVSATLYGANIAYARLASFAGVSGPTLVFYRVFIMLALVAVAALAMRRTIAMPREERGVMLVTGLAIACVGLFYLSSVAFIPVTVAVVVFYTFPILIVLASPFVEGTRLTSPILGIAGMALAGVVLVVGPAFHGLDWRGLALALAASLATATQFFAAARFRRTGVFAKVFWIHLLILPVTFLVGVATGSLHGPQNLALAPLAVAMTVGGYVIGFVLQFLALARISALVAGIVYCAEPVVAALTSTLVLGEGLEGIQFLGGALVLAAIVLNVMHDQRRAAAARLASLREAAP
jgi:drug/metabolite transporter (DMT)-like permease